MTRAFMARPGSRRTWKRLTRLFLLDSFSAEYGRGGAVSNLTIKSGSNQFHGAAYELLLNSALDGKDKGDILNNNPKVKSRENIFGFRVGGPIRHDRMFFFVSNLWDRYRATANLGILSLPTAAGYTTLQAYQNRPQVANLLQARRDELGAVFERARFRPGFRFDEGEAAGDFARGELRQVFAFLFRRAVSHQGFGADAGIGADAGAKRDRALRQLHRREHQLLGSEAEAAAL